MISQEELYPNGEPEKPNPKTGDEVEVFWPLDQKFYRGEVRRFDEKSTNYTINYDGGDREKLKFEDLYWRFSEGAADAAMSIVENMTDEIGYLIDTDTSTYSCFVDAFLNNPPAQPSIEMMNDQGASDIFITGTVQDKNDTRFDQANRDEIERLMKMGTYQFVPKDTISRS